MMWMYELVNHSTIWTAIVQKERHYRIRFEGSVGHVWVRKKIRRNIYKKKRVTLRIFESVFYKSLIRACSFDNFLAASQNARSYGQTINHRALRICKKRIQKVLMLSPFILINISSLVLSDSYNETLFKSLHNACVKLYWLISFVFVDGR